MPAAPSDQLIAKLPADRRDAIRAVRDVVRANLSAGYEEQIAMGMIAWVVALAVLPDTYNGQPLWLAALASKKNYMTLHLLCAYGDAKLDAWFRAAYAKAGKKLDMGKGCLRFKTLDALPLDVIGELVRKVPLDGYVAQYRKTRAAHAAQKTKTKAKPKAKAPTRSASHGA
jgi:hypothetical protein